MCPTLFGLYLDLTPSSVQSVIPVLIVHLMNIRASTLIAEKNLHYNRFKMCMMFLHELGDIYWHASFYHDFFQLAATFDTSFDSNSFPQLNMKTQDTLITFLKQQTGIRCRLPTRARLENEMANTMPSQDLQQSYPETHSYREPVMLLKPSIYDQGRDENRIPSILPSSKEIVDDSAPLDGMSSGNHNDNTNLDGMSSDVFDLLAKEDLQFEEWIGAHGNFQHLFPSV
jgi:hypothetical protein